MVTFLSSPLVLCALALPSDLADPCACTFERDALISSSLGLTPWFNLHIHGILSIVVRPCLSQHPPLPLPPTSMRGSSGLINLVASLLHSLDTFDMASFSTLDPLRVPLDSAGHCPSRLQGLAMVLRAATSIFMTYSPVGLCHS